MYHLICKYCLNPFERNRKTYQYCCRRCAYDDRIGQPQHPNSGKKRTKKPMRFVCQYCDISFQRLVYPSSKNSFEFCSPTCRNKSRILKDIPCPICGTMFKPQVHMTGGIRKKHCSKPCADKALIGHPSAKRTPKEIRQAVAALYPEFGPEPLVKMFGLSYGAIYQIANKQGINISPERIKQKYEAMSERMKGGNNPNWQGGFTFKKWGENWPEQRQKALKRDSYKCQVCFQFGRVIHHIKPRRLFADNIEKANELSNLITLCNKHHVPVEIGKIPCPKPRGL